VFKMINWERVLIKDLKKGLSLEDIANLAPQEVCYLSFKAKGR